MNKETNALMTRFPEYRKIIEKQMTENEDFKNLCSDYQLCMEMLSAIEKEADTKNFRLEEYQHIKKELENEAMKYLR